jgi:hypothetical protein
MHDVRDVSEQVGALLDERVVCVPRFARDEPDGEPVMADDTIGRRVHNLG